MIVPLILASLARESARLFLSLGIWEMLKPENSSRNRQNDTRLREKDGQSVGLAIISTKSEQSVSICNVVTLSPPKHDHP